MYFIGIDLGTSSVKSILIDEENKVIKSVTKDYPISYPKEGYAEQNPQDWWEKTLESIKELTLDIDINLLKSIGIAGQMHGLVALDKNGEVIRPAILWNDTRTKAETNYLNQNIGKDTLSQLTGNIAYAGFTLPKIMWMEENELENYQKISKILLPKDYIVYKLTNKYSSDYSDASGMLLLDVENKQWSEKMCQIGHVKKEWLPNLYESYEIVGSLTEDIKKIFGIKNEVNVIAGAGDNAAAAISVSAISENSCNISLGTSGTIFIPTDKFVKEENYGLHSFVHSSGFYHLMGCTLSAASSLDWWLKSILRTKEFDKEQDHIKNLGENRVYFLPYLNGERSPHNDEDVRGAFFGLSSSTSRKDMTLAVLEAVAYSLRDCLECAHDLKIYPKKATVVGGGSKSDLWCKILSNILQIPIYRIESENGPGLGAALLARYANQSELGLEEITRIDEENIKIFEPEKILVEKYNKGYEKYKSLYPMIKDFYKSY